MTDYNKGIDACLEVLKKRKREESDPMVLLCLDTLIESMEELIEEE